MHAAGVVLLASAVELDHPASGGHVQGTLSPRAARPAVGAAEDLTPAMNRQRPMGYFLTP